jgi:hypothetical protein
MNVDRTAVYSPRPCLPIPFLYIYGASVLSVYLSLIGMTGMQDDTSWKLGVDVGGTFTDAVLYNEVTGQTFKAKVLASRHL